MLLLTNLKARIHEYRTKDLFILDALRGILVEYCPSCQARLTPTDLGIGQCTQCGAPLGAERKR